MGTTQDLTRASPLAPMPTWEIFASTWGPPSSLPVTTLLSTMRPEMPDPHQHPR